MQSQTIQVTKNTPQSLRCFSGITWVQTELRIKVTSLRQAQQNQQAHGKAYHGSKPLYTASERQIVEMKQKITFTTTSCIMNSLISALVIDAMRQECRPQI